MARLIRIGVFGGSFDPPHIGHLVLADEALTQLNLERILWVLTPKPPHKPNRQFTPLEHRLAMLQLAIYGNKQFEISRVDIDRPTPHYALGTMSALSEFYPNARFYYLMGGDSLQDLPTWHEPIQFLESCTGIGVFHRPGEQADLVSLEKQLPGVSKKVHFIIAPRLEISSTILRERLSHTGAVRYYLPQAVFQYIEQYNLYRSGN